MFKKGTKAHSIFHNKCPRCQEGDFYINKKPYNLKHNLKLYDNCSYCNLKYMMEPDFYYGAMYITYAMTVLTCIIAFIIFYYLFRLNLIQIFISITVTLVVISPILLRLSRIIWINLFVKYNSKIKKKLK